jgi:uncharacterized protein
MKNKRLILWTTAMAGALTFFACVTINIYFPAEKVESVAGDIVDDIRGNKPVKEGGQSSNHRGVFEKISFALAPASAWADGETTVSNPTIRSLKEKMKARFQVLTPYYQKGALKEGANGYLSAVDAGGLSLKDRGELNGLVDAENGDRRTLYAEVAKALKIDPGQIDRIAEIFSKEWQKPLR